MALERRLDRLTPQSAPAPPSQGPDTTTSTVQLVWTAPPPVLASSTRIYLLDYSLNAASPERTLLIEVGVVIGRGLY